jgi:1,2-diacylglycerol 3-beta-galactosyltransferase
MSETKRVLILTADAGFGHRSAANAVAQALTEKYAGQLEFEIVNPLDDKRTPFFLRDSQTDYDRIVREAPELYRLGYDASEGVVTNALVESSVTVMLFEVLRDLLVKYQPDVVVTTFPLYQAPLEAVFTVFRYYIPVITVVTDLVSIHRMWFHRVVEYCLVPTEIVQGLALENGIPADKIKITGIPVNPQVVRETRPAAEIRKELGWDPELPTFLAVGSRRVEHLVDYLEVFNHFGCPLQLAAVAGKDAELYQKLQSVDWHIPVHLYEYSSNIPTLMHAADGLVCKAGGLIVTEALACGLPMMLVDVIPGQETGNADYVVQGGAADLTRTPIQVLETLAHWTMNDGLLLKERAKNARKLGQPQAAYQAADLIWKAADRGPVSKPAFNTLLRGRLIDLLAANQVHWDENPLHKIRLGGDILDKVKKSKPLQVIQKHKDD